MNPHFQGGPSAPPNMHNQHYSRRQHEYHQYQYTNPLSPGGHNPYAYPYAPHYYGQAMPAPYQMPRWAPQPPYAQYGMPPPLHNPQISPMIASSHPHMTRPIPYQPPSATPQSPYSNTHASSSASVLSRPESSQEEPHSESATPQPTSRRASSAVQPSTPVRMPFYPELPWYSSPEAEHKFPPREPRSRRGRLFQSVSDKVLLPSRTEGKRLKEKKIIQDGQQATPYSSKQVPAATTGTITDQVLSAPGDISTIIKEHRRADTKTHHPIIPALPHIPAARSKPPTSQDVDSHTLHDHANGDNSGDPPVESTPEDSQPLVSPKVAPKSWADLVRTKSSLAAINSLANGVTSEDLSDTKRAGSVGEVLMNFDVRDSHKVPFLEPRGLVNTGNMCYMNSILQVLVFCIPFYDFLDQVGKRAVHSFKSDTPLLDAMIMFMREYRVIDSAESVEKLKMRLKDTELEQYGDPLIPEYVYSVINQLPRFSSMRRGHQQDAEEFLGFLLAGLHDECVAAARLQDRGASTDTITSPTSASSSREANGWLEVGPKQKAAVTRHTGDPSASSPVSRIFGGTLRSELRVPGLKNSVTLEQYQPLQLDIGSPNVNNITDALKGLTKSESLIGDFNSPRGPGTTATKQVFIETLPPVLILHLKRFQYDSSGGTQKIWKRIGYPLDLELPKEVFPTAKRGGMAVNGGLPRYRLTAVVYHHGKSAAGGHYTVDLLRQDKREWVRLDDTLIRRIRPQDVAEAGADEDPKMLAKALEKHQHDQNLSKLNPYEQLDGDEDTNDDGSAWNDVNGNDHRKRWAGVAAAAAAGTSTPSTAGKRTPKRESVKDNKVAYILLYERT